MSYIRTMHVVGLYSGYPTIPPFLVGFIPGHFFCVGNVSCRRRPTASPTITPRVTQYPGTILIRMKNPWGYSLFFYVLVHSLYLEWHGQLRGRRCRRFGGQRLGHFGGTNIRQLGRRISRRGRFCCGKTG